MTTAAAAWRRDRAFYITMSILVVVSVLAGFARTYFLRPYFWPNTLPPYIHVHGAAFTTWIALFAVQIALIASRRTDVHRRLGWVAAGLAALMIPIALTAAVLSGQRNVSAGNVTGPSIGAMDTKTFHPTPASAHISGHRSSNSCCRSVLNPSHSTVCGFCAAKYSAIRLVRLVIKRPI